MRLPLPLLAAPLLAALLLAGLLAAPAARAADIVLVMNSNDANLSVLDRATGQELRTLPALREPHHWALTPDGKDLLVGDTAGNQLLVLDPATAELRRRIPVADPYQIGFSPNGKFFTVTGLARNQVDVYDSAYKLLHRFPLRAMPSHLAYSPDSATVFVSLQETNRLVAIDLGKMAVKWDVKIGDTPAGVLWLNNQVLVANMGSDDVAVADPADGHVIRRVKVGRSTHQLYLSPDKKTVYVNSRVSSTCTALDAATLAVKRVYRVPGGPDDLEFAPDGKIWFTERFAAKVAELDPATGALQSFPVGHGPHGIYLSRGIHD